MIGYGVRDRDFVIFERSQFPSLDNRHALVIEKNCDEEGFGALCLKKLKIDRGRSFVRNELGDDIDSQNPVITLHSANLRFSSWALDPSGHYRVRGVFRRTVHPSDVRLVSADIMQEAVLEGHAQVWNSIRLKA